MSDHFSFLYTVAALFVPGSATLAGLTGIIPISGVAIAAALFATFLALFAVSLIEAQIHDDG